MGRLIRRILFWPVNQPTFFIFLLPMLTHGTYLSATVCGLHVGPQPTAPSGPMDPVSVDRSMLTSAGPTAHVSKSDPPGDVMITASHVARSDVATCHHYEFSFSIIIY